MSKPCKECGEIKPINEFYKNKSMADGHINTCKECKKAYTKERMRVFRQRHKPEHDRYLRHWYLRHKYKISIEEYESMLGEQEGHCKLCDRTENLCVDHCHDTGKIRGILCASCNVGIGNLQDDPDLLRKAAEYLEKS
jgi:hypothetical protein